MDARMRRACAVAGLVAMLAGGARLHGAQRAARPPALPSTGAISGVVVDGSGRPLGGAAVFLGTTGRGPVRSSRQLTDSKGRFVFLNLPPSDQYFLNASKFGFLDDGYGRRGPEIGSRIVLAEGEWFSSARIVLRRPDAITGSVLDERSDPVVGVRFWMSDAAWLPVNASSRCRTGTRS